MDIHTLARRLSEEHQALGEFTDELSDCVETVPSMDAARWIERTRGIFEQFRSHVLEHMTLEEQDGYMTTVQGRRPQLAGEINRLMGEHQTFHKLLDSLRAEIREMTPAQPLLMRDFCHRVRDLIAYLRHHEHDENMLVLSAFSEDIGTKD